MLARVQSYLLQGIDALPCEVEVHVNPDAQTDGGPKATIVGLPDAGVKESVERVRAALTNSGFAFPDGRTLVNLAPADVRKEGPVYDLPIAIGMLLAQGLIGAPAQSKRTRATTGSMKPPETPKPSEALAGTTLTQDGLDPRQFLFAGELALDGRLRPVRGVLALASLAKAKGFRGVIVPADNVAEAAVVPGIEALGVRTLTEVVALLTGLLEPQPHPPLDIAHALLTAGAPVDFADVRGQEAVKRAITIAAAGSHNLVDLCASGRHGSKASPDKNTSTAA